MYGVGKYHVVHDTKTAAKCLLNDWPQDAHGPEFEEALLNWKGCQIPAESRSSKPPKQLD
nr:DUF982 domain-containing protein [Brucella intermedia]